MSKKTTKILVTGAQGLLGKYLLESLKQNDFSVLAYDKIEFNITDYDSILSIFKKERPTHVINCAAYTNVDKAEIEKELCYKVNFQGVVNLVAVINQIGAELIQISTDFVFDGTSSDGLYSTNDKKNTLNYYGFTKSLAEDYIIENALNRKIIRTSWLFGDSDNNFVNRIIKMSEEGMTIQVTDQQIGVPTYAKDLSDNIMKIIYSDGGIYHITNSGQGTRYDYANNILMLTTRGQITVNNDTKGSVLRPKKVILVDNSMLAIRHWKEALAEYLFTYK